MFEDRFLGICKAVGRDCGKRSAGGALRESAGIDLSVELSGH